VTIEINGVLEGSALAYLDKTASIEWLKSRLESTGIQTLSKLAQISGINKGTLSKYFNQIQRPTIDVVAILCKSLEVTPSELLFGLGALDHSSESADDTIVKPGP
jgi:transcriptional regulator with XRE-family HTH domain